MSKSLFLHMGPGMNAAAERRLLAGEPDFAAVDFWDQPESTGPQAFTNLVEAAITRAEALSHLQGGRIHLVAHSFGGQIAREIIRKRPDLVESARLISTGHNLPGGFLRLLSRLAVDPETSAPFAESVRDALPHLTPATPENFWEIITLVVQDPAFMRLYWPKREWFDAFTAATRLNAPLHFPTFQDVVNESLTKSSIMPTRMAWEGKVELVLGSRDPLIDLEESKTYWRTLFPHIKIEVRENSGHYPHLEDRLHKK